MSADKPIHVRVAEVLGWTDMSESRNHAIAVGEEDGSFPSLTPRTAWIGIPPGEHNCPCAWMNEPCDCVRERFVPRFDRKAELSMPLLWKYGMTVQPITVTEEGQVPKIIGWEAKAMNVDQWSNGETLLLAVCEAVLKAEGR